MIIDTINCYQAFTSVHRNTLGSYSIIPHKSKFAACVMGEQKNFYE